MRPAIPPRVYREIKLGKRDRPPMRASDATTLKSYGVELPDAIEQRIAGVAE